MLPRINWMREKFCKHPGTNEEHGFESDQASAGKSHEQIHKQCSHNQVWIALTDFVHFTTSANLRRNRFICLSKYPVHKFVNRQTNWIEGRTYRLTTQCLRLPVSTYGATKRKEDHKISMSVLLQTRGKDL